MIRLCLGLLLAFPLGEIYLRWRSPKAPTVQDNFLVLPTNRTYIYRNSDLRGCDPLIIHHTNSLGFRGPEFPANFKSTLTILAVGGSTTQCFYLSDGHSWPELLGQYLSQSFHPVWLNNAGLDGHSTFSHIRLLQHTIVPLHPKVVLYLVGANDLGRDDLVDEDRLFLRSQRERGILRSTLKTLSDKSLAITWLQNVYRAWIARRKGLAHRSLDLTHAPKSDVPATLAADLVKLHQTRYVPGFAHRLNELVNISRQNHIIPILITHPALYGQGIDDITGVNLESVTVDNQMNGRLAWRVLELYNDATRKTARDLDVPLIDLAHELKKSSEYYYDFYHFTNAGSEAAAHHLYTHLHSILAEEYPQFLIKNSRGLRP
jgi:lysophospholipase L1-like esterase